MSNSDKDDPLCPVRNNEAGFARRDGEERAAFKWFWLRWGSVALVGIFCIWFIWSSLTSSFSAAVDAVTPSWPCETRSCGVADWAKSKWPWGNDSEPVTVSAPTTVETRPMTAEAAELTPASDSEPAEVAEAGCSWYGAVCKWKQWRGTADD